MAATETTQKEERRDGDRNVGRIEEIQGVVIEAVFPDQLPEINHALLITRERAAGDDESISPNLICEVW
jgi:F-type H+/Na+-transporting ATPase subunit beta